jgi:hypothetical protein
VEVPALIILVNVAFWLRKRFFTKWSRFSCIYFSFVRVLFGIPSVKPLFYRSLPNNYRTTTEEIPNKTSCIY